MVRLILITLGLAIAAPAHAGWLSIRNDTDKTVYVQEAPEGFLPGLFAKRRKVIRLQPGEVYREFQAKDGERSVDVFDAASPASPSHKAILKWGKADVTFHLNYKPAATPNQPEWVFSVPKGDERPGDATVVTVKNEQPPAEPKR